MNSTSRPGQRIAVEASFHYSTPTGWSWAKVSAFGEYVSTVVGDDDAALIKLDQYGDELLEIDSSTIIRNI